ncbi:MAG: hypothetical protein ACE5IY_18620 [bacterium]
MTNLERLFLGLSLLTLSVLFSCSKGQQTPEPDSGENTVQEVSSEPVAWNKVCPVSGGEVDLELPTVAYQGRVVGFCCPGCDEKFIETPEQFLKKLSQDGSEVLEM